MARDLGRVLGEEGELDRRAARDLARRGLELAGEQLHQRRLARAVDADDRDAVARAEAPGRVAQQHLVAVGDRDALGVEHLVAQAGASRSAAARSCRAARARRRSARWRPRSGTSAWRCAPAARGAATRAPCGSAAGGAPRAPRPGARARRGRARRPRSRLRTGGPSVSATSHVSVQTASRNQRSWVTTSIEPRRAARWRASQSTPSTSRWLVGSSSSSSSGWSSSVLASAIRRRSPPRQRRDRRVQPVREARDRDAAQQAVEHVAVLRVRAPLVVGAPADQLLADRAVRVQVVALAEHLHVQAARARDGARVRLLGARDQPQQRRLAVAVAADDADPVAGRDAERDVLQHGARGVALGGVLEVDEVAW